jgi:oligo-1,6-glucosidase/alpha-glucosidase
MKIVFDLVLNHSSSEHPWFQESKKSKDNPKSDWYVWKDGKGDDPPNNWHSALGMNGWTYDSSRQQLYYSAFLPFQPDLNWRNPEVKEEMFRMVRHWLDKGVDGFRLDIFNFIYEDQSFTDNPTSLRYLPTEDLTELLGQKKVYNMNHPDNFKLAKELRSILDEYDPPRFMVGEVFGDHTTLQKFLGENADGLNMIFLFEISNLKWTAEFFKNKIEKFEAYYPVPYVPTFVFSNHDRIRSIDLLEGDPEKAKCLALIQLSLRGVPYFYYGEEIGMSSGSISLENAEDPLPKAFAWLPKFLQGFIFNRDNYRTPMQWNSMKNAGFTGEDIETWLPVNDGHQSTNVDSQKNIDYSILENLRSLINLRNEEVSLQLGYLNLEKTENEELLILSRKYKDENVTVMINFSDEDINVDKDGELLHSTKKLIINNNTIELQPNSGIIVKQSIR